MHMDRRAKERRTDKRKETKLNKPLCNSRVLCMRVFMNQRFLQKALHNARNTISMRNACSAASSGTELAVLGYMRGLGSWGSNLMGSSSSYSLTARRPPGPVEPSSRRTGVPGSPRALRPRSVGTRASSGSAGSAATHTGPAMAHGEALTHYDARGLRQITHPSLLSVYLPIYLSIYPPTYPTTHLTT